MIESLAISEGWTVSGPSANQLRLPLTANPRPVWVRASRTTATSTEGQASSRRNLRFIRLASHAAGRPMITQVSCLRKM